MKKKIDIGPKAKVCLSWNVPYAVSEEQEKNMISLMAKKYGIPEKNIKIDFNYKNSESSDGILVSDVQNIYDPQFQLDMMKQYIKEHDLKDVDFDEIVKIDSQINTTIDYDSYEKGKRYSIKWLKWSNFLSYGPDNFFDFTKLHGLVLLNGEPANKSGKSTFAYDLLHFLLFGKTSTEKAKTLGDLFNNYLPDEKTLNIEGCITIDGQDYIIKRTLTRSGGKKKTVTNKVEYYKVNINGDNEILVEENQKGTTTTETTKIIKDAIGNENDFDMIISANAKDLDSLITETTEAEKGRILSRWIGLSIIEDKSVKAREKWNKEISVGRYSDMYNRVALQNNIVSLTESNKEIALENENNNKKIKESDDRISEDNKTRDLLLSSKQPIDENLLKTDVSTLESSIASIIDQGKRKKSEIKILEEENKNIGEIVFSEEEYKSIRSKSESVAMEIAEATANYNNLKKTNDMLANAEYCPTCHRKLENVDNSAQIAANKKEMDAIVEKGKALRTEHNTLLTKMTEIEKFREIYHKKSQNELKIASLNVIVSNLVNEYKEKKSMLEEIQKNKDAITKNSEIDARINVINANIRTEENLKKEIQSTISANEREIVRNNETISQQKSFILKIDEEQKTEKYWKLYLQMIGKDGISKMVLRTALPMINAEINKILEGATDFRIEVVMNEKNDVDFILIRDNVFTRLSAASGLEKTQSALALRVVLGKMSRLSRPPFILLDEILGTVAKENYDDMKRLYDKITDYYDFILHITHISDIVDWHKDIITVRKVNNISSIK